MPRYLASVDGPKRHFATLIVSPAADAANTNSIAASIPARSEGDTDRKLYGHWDANKSEDLRSNCQTYSSMYDVSLNGLPSTRWRRHAAANAVIMSEKTAHDDESPNGSALMVK